MEPYKVVPCFTSNAVKAKLSRFYRVQIEVLQSFGKKKSPSSFLHSIVTCRKDEGDYFSRNFVCIHVLRTTTTRHIVNFIDVYFHFLANVMSCYMKPVHDTNREPGLPVHLLEYYTSRYKWNYNNQLTYVINRAIRTSKKKKRTRCVIAGNRHYILDLKHNKKSAFFFSYSSQTLKLHTNNKLCPYLPPKMLSL